ncbi:MAG: TRAP transporter substrate-binding protein DctP [Deltaproteobacteria bacterium]|nr:TRAP transporter substrate-binding protein DctP [Deltaproteobacteria bacterium]MBW1874563.1 TRAP transporter substrate-binding protein DctP [Deltaproteobacteria bacterium]MBW2380344.1 TRAP transporter substrate-binding protein DctP [Deltaproteobacteria bacterium]MBW2550073.1 TRAP transporter substrate-binding protein DctP [Deltaproteobacteria bacterium]MBW2626742.1 TRAP transporter substrate-binding protein DctP [Deltaproteobacteria bacterium]
MNRMKHVFVALLAASALLLPGAVSTPQANAASPIIIRFASLAPSGSGFMKLMKAWNRSLKKETENRVELRFYSGGSQGDERDFIRKVRAGQMDAAGVTTTGLGIVARPVLVLTAPGLITEYDQLERARTQLGDRFAKLFKDNGFMLLAWGEAGKNRIFSMDEFAKPDDLKRLRPWAWKDDPVFAGYITTIGANPVRMGVPEVYGGLQTRMLDTVPASALAAVALQWYTRLNYMAKENFGILIGGSLIKQEKFDELTEHDQKVLIDTSERAARAGDTMARRDDARAYASLVKRGMIEVDTSPYKAEWDAVATKTREKLTGRVYSKSLLEAVEKAVANK